MLYQLSHVRTALGGCDQNCSRSCRSRKLGSPPDVTSSFRHIPRRRTLRTRFPRARAVSAPGHVVRPMRPDQPFRRSITLRRWSKNTCYDHLAGKAGVELLDGMLRRGLLEEKSGRTDRGNTSSLRFEVTGAGRKDLGSFGLNLPQLRRSRRRFAGTSPTGPSAVGT